jgi:predicted ATP-grasp superfamily ATP-dependent carboligase
MVGSVAFVANGQRAVGLGVTEQLIGRRAFGASGYQWCGNLLPALLPHDELIALMNEAQALANHVTTAFGLYGVNGVDFIWHGGRIWTIEINPRPSASLELMDAAYNLRVFNAHVQSFFGALPQFDLAHAITNSAAMGKAVLFTRLDVAVGDTSDWWQQGIRDIPHSGEHIARGHPVCTLLARGATPGACLRKLRMKAGEVRGRLAAA